ncbi:membrane protein [Clostridium polyendosporum]|uniref:Membrane protein n=1 Tax=Clostridium polyendosporum TaxID=69208 RepID=A0A919VFP5_9CLOT|nr:TIGR04086 family membrane protein [Clostridium polyendosporum]GIM28635.1 membrane protein [Clostridium polyendosporum]
MNWNKYIGSVTKGVLRAIIATVFLVIVLSICMSFVFPNIKTLSVAWVVITCISILLGSVYAARKNGEKGWFVGLGVAFLYYIGLLILSAVFKDMINFTIADIYRMLIALVIGVLSGMLGINI